MRREIERQFNALLQHIKPVNEDFLFSSMLHCHEVIGIRNTVFEIETVDTVRSSTSRP